MANLELIISVVGITVGTVIAFVLPPIMHTLAFWQEWTTTRQPVFIVWQVAKAVMLITLGLFGIVFGLYSNVIER